MLFVETPVFTELLRKNLDDDSYRALQIALLLRPEQGLLIPGSGGKNEQGDLTVEQSRRLARLVREEFS